MIENEKMVFHGHLIFSDDVVRDTEKAVTACAYDRLFVLVDENTRKHCWPILQRSAVLRDAHLVTIGCGDVCKTLETVVRVWQTLGEQGATRHSCMVCLGGGMVTDLGGFAASTFKRGIDFINVPTTLLAQVDASVGGKTGCNFGGLKNEIGLFSESRSVVLSTQFLATLDWAELLSGYAEMIKHALISGAEMWRELTAFDILHPDWARLQRMVAASVAVKERIVAEDPTEKGLRRALNLGHTIGHAFESWAMAKGRPVPHGFAVAYGLVCELYLSCVKTGFPIDRLRQVAAFVREHYGRITYTCDDYAELLRLMRHDKKNTAGHINFTLLADLGEVRIDQIATEKEITEALDFYRDGQ